MMAHLWIYPKNPLAPFGFSVISTSGLSELVVFSSYSKFRLIHPWSEDSEKSTTDYNSIVCMLIGFHLILRVDSSLPTGGICETETTETGESSGESLSFSCVSPLMLTALGLERMELC